MGFSKKFFLMIILTFFLHFFIINPCLGVSPKITIILIDRISLEELLEFAGPFLRQKIEKSSLALMNTNSSGSRTSGNTHATLGAGSPAYSDRPGGLALNYDEEWMGIKAGTLYQQLTGDNFPLHKVIIPRIAEATRLNFSPTRTSIPCLLGSVLKENHFSCSVLGNSDLAPPVAGNTYYSYSRFAPWLAADRHGLVERGDVGVKTIKPAKGLIPWESNYQYILDKYRQFREKTDLLILELGDLSRLDNLNSYLFDQMLLTEKKRLFASMDQFFQELWPILNFDQEVLILISPTPSTTNTRMGNLLTPLILWGGGYMPGLLNSPSTRRPGLVANIDLAPTVFRLFNINTPAYVSGRPITFSKQGGTEELLAMNKKISKTAFFRRKTLPFFLNLTSLVLPLLLAVYLICAQLNFPKLLFYKFWFPHFPLFLSTLPFSLHLASQLPLTSLFTFLLTALGFGSLLMLVVTHSKKYYGSRLLLLPIYFTIFIIFVDLLTGNYLVKSSIFGYDPMLGARYYGMGNEISGLFLGSIIALCVFREAKKNKLFEQRIFWCLIVSAFLLASPFAGANFGAGLTAFAMAIILLFITTKAPHSYRQILYYSLFLILFGLLLISFDYFCGNPERQTHFGFLLKNYKLRGITAVAEVILRKLQVNLRLLSSKWAFLFLSSLATLLVTYFYKNRPFPIAYLLVILSGGLVGLLLNDSGLVFSALLFYLPATTILFLLEGIA
ncbi:MAG TPA: hypothetical protein DEB05_13540 [Firmicutes bacterium]|jgi:hypothetical protein|nr:hypothetical protein [Bacillota bacterium]HBT17966.1 hypothetical protein [Bacillota bacterium]